MTKTIYHKSYRKLVRKLRTTRTSKGLTQSMVADRIGISRTWVGKVENHDLRLDVLYLVRLCRVYGIPAHELVNEMEEELSEDDSSFLPIRANDTSAPALYRSVWFCTMWWFGFARYDLISNIPRTRPDVVPIVYVNITL